MSTLPNTVPRPQLRPARSPTASRPGTGHTIGAQHVAPLQPPGSGRTPRDSRAGSLLVVRGLAPGADTSTISYLVALTAAQAGGRPVLIADLDSAGGGRLAALAGVRSPVSLADAARRVASQLPLPAGITARGPSGLRVLATATRSPGAVPPAGVTGVLASARRTHPLTVIDCGATRSDAVTALGSQATHLAWVIPADQHRVAHATAAIAGLAAPHGHELIIALHTPDSQPPLVDLRRLAADRRATLILFPSVDRARIDRTQRAAAVPLQAILGALTR